MVGMGDNVKATMLLAIMLMLGGSAWAEEPSEVVLQTIAMESASRPEGMPYVAVTLINRARERGTTLEHEALRHKQYSCWNDAGWAKAWLAKHYTPSVRLGALKALKMGMVEAVKYPDMRHYHTVGTAPYWSKGHTPVLILGGHKWYEGIK